MKSVISNKWYYFFIIVYLLLFSYEWLQKLIDSDSAIEFYIESITIIFNLIVLYAVIRKPNYLAKVVSIWAIATLIVCLFGASASIYWYNKYSDYANEIGFQTAIYWTLRFFASCLVLIGGRKWITKANKEDQGQTE